jgi:Ca-activated chloride channel homolog
LEAGDVISFGDTAYFALGILVVLMAFGVFRLARWRRDAREDFAGPRSRAWPSLAYWPRSVLLLAAAALIVFAAARPQWGSREITRDVQGIDLVIVLDVSQSMTADDVDPTRMKVAQDNLATLVQAQDGSRFGLVFFAGTPFKRSPLSADGSAITQIILRADRDAGLTRVGSDLGAALQVAGEILSGSENAGRAVLLVSDGEDHAGTYRDQAAALAEQGVVIYTAGVGTQGGALLYDVNQDGQREPKVTDEGPVISRLVEESLRSIADAGGGDYVHMDGSSTTALLGIRNDLARLDQTPLGSETQNFPIERFQYFVAAALVLLLLAWFTPSRLPLPSMRWLRRARRWHALAAVLLAVLLVGCSEDPLRERNQAANEQFEAGNYAEALVGYQSLIAERPDVDEFSYNAGNTLHRLGNHERAATETQRALPPRDPAIGADIYYALGNHLLALQRLEEAYLAYRNALLLDPSDQDAKFNLEYALLLIQQRDNPPPPGEEAPQGQGEGQTPPAGEGQQPGESTPEPGATGEPGEGSPTPGTGDPGQPGEGVPPADGTPGGNAEGLSPEALQRALAEALAGIDEELTFEEAVRILDLLRQQQERQVPSPSGSSGPDY